MSLFLGTDDSKDVQPVLHELLARLRECEYERTQVIPFPAPLWDLVFDPVNCLRAGSGRSNLFHPSGMAGVFRWVAGLTNRRAAEFHAFFFDGIPCSPRRAEDLFGRGLLARALEIGAVEATGHTIRPNLLVAPFEGGLYVSDPVSFRDRSDYVYLGRASFAVVEALHRAGPRRQPKPGSRLLDLACGAGIGACACAQEFDEVIGADLVERCLRFSRLNAELNGVRNATFHWSDILSRVEGTFDLVLMNTPCDWAESEFGPTAPKFFADGGGAFGTELAARMISEALPRLRDGGEVYAIFSAPILHGEPYAARLLERLCAGRGVRVVLHALFEQFRYRDARVYRKYGISKMVRYLVTLRPADRLSIEFADFDSLRLWSYRVRALPPRWMAALTGGPRVA